MHPAGQIAQCLMHGAMAGDAGHGGQSCGAKGYVEMRLAALAPAGMALMAVAVVADLQHLGREGRIQTLTHFVNYGHFYRLPLQSGVTIIKLAPPSRKGPAMSNRPPFEFDLRVSSDKARRKTGRRGSMSGAFETSQRICDYPECKEKGVHRAPKSPDHLDEFFWFCRDHVREYNLKWNYFGNVGDEEFQKLLEKDRLWERETRPFSKKDDGRSWQRLGIDDPMQLLGEKATQNPGKAAATATRKLPSTERKALEILEARDTWTRPEIRKQYKALVKDLHPDMNGGNRADEDRLQEVVWAWEQIKDSRYFRD